MTTNKESSKAPTRASQRPTYPPPSAPWRDNIQWTEADGFPLAGTYVGPQAVLEGVFMRLGEIGNDVAVVPEKFIADGDTVVALGIYRWKNRNSGEPAVVKMAHVLTMDGGKAVAFQQHVDTHMIRELS